MSAASSPNAGPVRAASTTSPATSPRRPLRERLWRVPGAPSPRPSPPPSVLGGRFRRGPRRPPPMRLDMAEGVHDIQAGGAPGGIEGGEGRGDQRQAEGLSQHAGDDEDLDGESAR